MSAPPSEARFSGAFDQRDGSPTRSPLAGGRSPPSTMRSLLTRGTSPGRSDGNLNGLVDMAAFRDARDAEFQGAVAFKSEIILDHLKKRSLHSAENTCIMFLS